MLYSVLFWLWQSLNLPLKTSFAKGKILSMPGFDGRYQWTGFELRTEFLHFSANSKVKHQDLVKHYIIFQSHLLTWKMSFYFCWCLCWGTMQRSDNNVMGCNQHYRTHTIISLSTLNLCAIIGKYNIQNIWQYLPAVQCLFFHCHNPSDRTMALGLTKPLAEMSTRRISWG